MAREKRYYSYNEEDLKFENEIRKLKLRAELGMSLGPEPAMSPEQEKEWLKRLEEEEKAWADLPRLTVFQYLGEPRDIKPLAKLTRQEIETELAYIQSMLLANNVEVVSMAPVSPAVLYRFLTEEVFFEEIPTKRSQGVTVRFVYEDFHPNLEQEIRETIKDFFQKTFDKSWKHLEGQFAPKVQSYKPSTVSRQVILEKLRNWVEPCKDIFLAQIEFIKLEVSAEEAIVAVSAHYEGTWSANEGLFSCDVLANFQLKNKDGGYWSITGIFMPCLH